MMATYAHSLGLNLTLESLLEVKMAAPAKKGSENSMRRASNVMVSTDESRYASLTKIALVEKQIAPSKLAERATHQ